MFRALLPLILTTLLLPAHNALRFDALARENNRTVLDTQLERFVETSVEWLHSRALQLDYPELTEYTDQLQRVLRPSCRKCFDYFEAVAVLRSLGKIVKQILEDDKDDVHYPVVRRSYVATVWMLQRSRLFAWQTSHLHSNVLSTMFRMYVHHTNRAKGRVVSFHHISKCGGTTMCQLAASNRCSNPSMDQERNCVLESSLDGPIWMVAHDVTRRGAVPNATAGLLDVSLPPVSYSNMTLLQRVQANRNFSTEPKLPMWLMYACPYQEKGKPYNCRSRTTQAQESRSTFLANERTLSKDNGASQVCHQFTNAIILREPVPHVVSLLAEVKFRYVRQLRTWHKITNWQPPGWNLTWWETFGPALVGSYATRTLVGREAFCRSAANTSAVDLSQAVDSLLGFDMVMTLDRAADIDLVVSTMLGWPARSFSNQPASRVREFKPPIKSDNGATLLSFGKDEWPIRRSLLNESPLLGGVDQGVQRAGSEPAGDVAKVGRFGSWFGTHNTEQQQQQQQLQQPASNSAFSTAAWSRKSRVFTASSLTRTGSSADAMPGATQAISSQPAWQSYGSSSSSSSSSLTGVNHQGMHVHSKFSQAVAAPQPATPPAQGIMPGAKQQHKSRDLDYDGFAEAGDDDDDDDDDFDGADDDDDDDEEQKYTASDSVTSDEEFERAAAELSRVFDHPRHQPPPPPAVPLEVLEATAAVALVKSSWLDRQAARMGSAGAGGVQSPAAASAGGLQGGEMPELDVEHTHQLDKHGAHLVLVRLSNTSSSVSNSSNSSNSNSRSSVQERGELWHAFPRHGIAFTAADMARLEKLTALDLQLVQTADLLFDLDTVWLQSLLRSHHYRRRMKTVATTYTACGFSGMMPLTDTVQDHVFQGKQGPVHKQGTPWIS